MATSDDGLRSFKRTWGVHEKRNNIPSSFIEWPGNSPDLNPIENTYKCRVFAKLYIIFDVLNMSDFFLAMIINIFYSVQKNEFTKL